MHLHGLSIYSYSQKEDLVIDLQMFEYWPYFMWAVDTYILFPPIQSIPSSVFFLYLADVKRMFYPSFVYFELQVPLNTKITLITIFKKLRELRYYYYFFAVLQ